MSFVRFIGVVGIIFVGAIAVLLIIHALPLSSAVLRDPHRRWALDRLPAAELPPVKMNYANESDRFDIGLFGNSRIVMVGTDVLNLPSKKIFNFGIPGQSIRQSVRLIDELRTIDKLPKTIVVSMDHIELGLPGGDGVYPSAFKRLILTAKESWSLFRTIGLRATAVQIINALSNERQIAAVAFNPVYVSTKLKTLAAEKAANGAYRLDGSRDEGERPDVSAPIEIPQRADRYPQLEYDLEALGALRREGYRVIVFESPLAPAILDRIEHNLSERARDVRQRLHAACSRLQLECLAPPLLNGLGWVERDHAPASLLGAWLAKTIRSGG